MAELLDKLLNFSIMNIDKPSGPTSFSVSDYVRKRLKISKTSHFGTLDPKVTGVLPIALGRACKLTGFFLGHDKTYTGILHTHKEISLEALQKIINENFMGKIKQTPPKKSKVKRAEREREIKKFELLEKNQKDFLFKAEVQGGTYIRKLCHDLGIIIGGAHMAELRRTDAGIFNESTAIRLYQFEELLKSEEELSKVLIPAEEAIKKIMPSVQVNPKSIKSLLNGKPVFKQDIIGKIPDSEIFAIFHKENLIEIAKKFIQGDVIAKPEFVFN